MADLSLGLVLFLIGAAGIWIAVARPEVAKRISSLPSASEALALVIVISIALGATYIVSGILHLVQA